MSRTQRRRVELLGESVEYEVRHSSDASEPRIDIDIHRVTVVLPGSGDEYPAELLKENAAWVIEKKRRFDEYRADIPERRFAEGEMFPYLGEDCEILVEQRPSSIVDGESFRLASHHVEETSVKRALETLYRRKARERFEARADHFAEQMELAYEKIEVRNQRTKWGSCSTSGTLGLNWRLLMAPPDVLDYVVVHELAHLREQNHTSEFWRLVGEYIPDYERRAQWLNEHSVSLIFTEDDL